MHIYVQNITKSASILSTVFFDDNSATNDTDKVKVFSHILVSTQDNGF